MTTMSFTVFGVPQPSGSKKAFQHPHTGRIVIVEDAKHSRPWKDQIAAAAQHAVTLHDWPEAHRGPVQLDVCFYVQRPKGHNGTGRNTGLLRDSAPAWPAVKPDCTKLLRAAEDALTGIVFYDDAQVVVQRVRKCYDSPARVEITVRMLPTTVADNEAVAL